MKLVISAGETSGDEHGADVVRSLKRYIPSVEVRGMGGRALSREGVGMEVDALSAASVMGFAGPLSSMSRIVRAYRSMTTLLSRWQPDALIVINYSDFNLELASAAKRRRIPVLFYIPPQLWAWRSGRIRKMRRAVDVAAVIFPFERDFYRDRGFHHCVYVGHPFSDRYHDAVLDQEKRAETARSLSLDPDRPIVALLPGSRKGEVRSHLEPMTGAFSLLRERVPNVQAALPVAPGVEHLLGEVDHEIRRIPGEHSLALMQCASAGLIKSGTSNLQAAFCGLPFAMFYRTSPFAEFVVRRFVNLDEYSIVNIIRRGTVRELLQQHANPKEGADELESLLVSETRRRKLRDDLRAVVRALSDADAPPLLHGCVTASDRVARLAAYLACGEKESLMLPSSRVAY
jgi:lipid-A-disaccharide synthase